MLLCLGVITHFFFSTESPWWLSLWDESAQPAESEVHLPGKIIRPLTRVLEDFKNCIYLWGDRHAVMCVCVSQKTVWRSQFSTITWV